jgi:hypothetical protein
LAVQVESIVRDPEQSKSHELGWCTIACSFRDFLAVSG